MTGALLSQRKPRDISIPTWFLYSGSTVSIETGTVGTCQSQKKRDERIQEPVRSRWRETGRERLHEGESPPGPGRGRGAVGEWLGQPKTLQGEGRKLKMGLG